MRSDVQVPDGWQVVRLEDVANVKSGTGFPLDRQGRRNGTYPFIKVSDMNLKGNETYITSANNYVDPHDAEELRANIFTPGTIVFPKVGAAIATNKKRALSVPTVIDNNMVGVTVSNIDKCDARFLHSWFEFVDLNTFANVSAVPSITGSRLKQVLIPLPPLTEQRAIAGVLDAIDEATERTEAVIAATEQLRDSLLHELLTRGVPGWHTEWTEVAGVGTVPACWGVVRLEEVAKVERGKFTHRPRNEPRFYGGVIPFIQTGDVVQSNGRIKEHSQTLNELGLSISRLFQAGTIVITIAANIGETAITTYPVAFPDSLVGILPTGVDTRFLEYSLRTQKTRLRRSAPESAQKNVNLEDIRGMLIPLPKREEQLATAAALDAVGEAIEQTRRGCDELKTMKSSAAEVLLTGRLRVTKRRLENV